MHAHEGPAARPGAGRDTPRGVRAERGPARRPAAGRELERVMASRGPGRFSPTLPSMSVTVPGHGPTKVGAPDTPHEREAERAAEGVVAGATSDPAVAGTRVATSTSPTGQPLDPADRAFFQSRLGADFGDVRLHAGGDSARLAATIGAHAFTVGNDVYLGANAYRPGTAEGRRLLGHELTHVVQQRAGALPIAQPAFINALAPDCDVSAGLPMHETGTLARGTWFTPVFPRPASGSVTLTVTASSTERDCTFGVNVWQCHIISDEALDTQRVATVGTTISYSISLPAEAWNTYEKYAVRVRVNCTCDVEVRVS